MSYDDSMLGRMSSKSQSATVDGVESVALTTGFGGYEYRYGGNGAPPRALSSYGHGPAENNLNYDVNGNMTSHISDGNLTTAFTKNMYWNSNNLMRGIKVDDYMIQHYMYDAEGQRVFKAKGDITTAGTNGNNTTSAVLNPYTIYPSGHITISASGRYTKHYYSGSERIVSRLSGVYNDFISSEDLSVKKAIQKDGELALLQSDLGIDNLTAITPPPPTYDDDCIDQYPDIESEDYKQCRCEQNPTLCPENVFYFFHSDQLGSSSVLTDFDGNPYQFLVYLPWGEVLGEQKAAQFSTPYQFNGKELDSETGLYNYGARYYDPSLSVWLGVDPLADRGPGWSPYRYGFNNPIRFIDPDGRFEYDNIGVDGDGNVIFDDGKDDGNLFLVDDGIDEINSLKELESNSSQLTKNHAWVGSENELVSYVKSQWKQSGNDLEGMIDQMNIKFDNSKYGFSVVGGMKYRKDREGNITANANPDFNITLSINYKKDGMNLSLSNPYNTRNALAHEKQHIKQAISHYHQEKGWAPYDRAGRELEAISLQRTLPSWKRTTQYFKDAILNYEKKWK